MVSTAYNALGAYEDAVSPVHVDPGVRAGRCSAVGVRHEARKRFLTWAKPEIVGGLP
jgi:hypothetical protein